MARHQLPEIRRGGEALAPAMGPGKRKLESDFITDDDTAAQRPAKKQSNRQAVQRSSAVKQSSAAQRSGHQAAPCTESEFFEGASTATAAKPRPTCQVNFGAVGSSLQIAATVAPHRGDSRTTYELDGADPDRVRERLANAKCPCKSRPCFKAIQYRVLLPVCILFWSLTSSERALLLRESYYAAVGKKEGEEEEEAVQQSSHQAKASWSLCGKPVCFPIFCNLLGTGTVTTRNALHSKPDMRRSSIGSGAGQCKEQPAEPGGGRFSAAPIPVSS